MAVVRFFAHAREATGVSVAEMGGTTVQEVLEEAVKRFGTDFANVLAISKIWRNGEEADLSEKVSSSDEIAVLPPVSGGA